MKPFRRITLADQTATHLRAKLRTGQWGGKLPGVVRLCAETQVSQTTMRAALRQLEAEGLISPGGSCRSRVVAAAGAGGSRQQTLRVGILLHDARHAGSTKGSPVLLDPVCLAIQHALETAGHAVVFAAKSQVDLKYDVPRIIRLVARTPADAWIVQAGSRQLLEWFAGQSLPCIALYGRSIGLPLASTGPDKMPTVVTATRQLIALGHRRIVLITRSPRRKPTLGSIERAFLAELAANDILTGDYNLPDWEETPKGYSDLLASLFRTTPPTALIIEETPRVIAALQFLARHHIDVPEHVSLVSADYDESLGWCHPTIAHMRWDITPVVRRVARWVSAVARGRGDRERITYPAEFVPGGSIGPAWQG